MTPPADAPAPLPPPPGSPEAVARGCRCSVSDNAHGKGWMGGVKDLDRKTLYVMDASCPLHGGGRRAAGEEGGTA